MNIKIYVSDVICIDCGSWVCFAYVDIMEIWLLKHTNKDCPHSKAAGKPWAALCLDHYCDQWQRRGISFKVL